MTDPLDAKAATLAALATWSASSRDQLVAAAWRAGNRDITELARAARRGRQAIYQYLQKHGINPPTDRQEPPVTQTAPTDVPVPGWRHPNLTSLTVREQWGQTKFSFTIAPFTGDEPEPQVPEQWQGKGPGESDWNQSSARVEETRMVRRAWAQARYERLFKALYDPRQEAQLLADHMRQHRQGIHSSYHPVGYTGTAGDVWAAHVAARDALAAAYEAMKTQPDNEWRAGLGRIVDRTEPAEKAARNWDDVAYAFVQITDWYCGYVGSYDWDGTQHAIEQTGKKLGLDVNGWVVAYDLSSYNNRTSEYADTAGAEIVKIINAGREWLRQVDRLAGKR